MEGNTKWSEADDGTLLLLIGEGEQGAFQALFWRYCRYTAAVAVRTGSGALTPEDVEEICADVFARLWASRRTVRPQDGQLRSWLGTVARNLALNRLRRNRRRPEETGDSAFHGAAASAEDDCLAQEELSEALRIVDALEPDERELFLRRYYWCERVTDLAAEKGETLKSVSARLARIRRKLQGMAIERGIR